MRYLLFSMLTFGWVIMGFANKETPKYFGFQQLSNTTFADEKEYPKDYFAPPLDIPLVLSGNFGELRSNHFHSGIDIKTQGVTGKNVLASADGYVSRVKISPWGYGKAVYITHPNGYTTVYAHLDEILGDLGAYIKQQQVQQQSFAVDLFPGKNRFSYVQGQVFAKSGNSGGSGGPHLHFEIRETATERPVNPLHFGFAIQDNIPPVIQGVQVHPLSEDADVNGLHHPFAAQLDVQGKGVYALRNTITAAGDIGFSINTFDRQNGASNQNGVYRVEMFVNNEKRYDFKADKLDFNETRYLNALIDYERFYKLKNRYHKTFLEPGIRLNMFPYIHPQRGVVSILPDSLYQVEIRTSDIEGNQSVVKFEVRGKPITRVPDDVHSDSLIKHNQSYYFQTDSVRIQLPAHVLYRNTPFTYAFESKRNAVVSGVHHILEGSVPAHKYFTVKIKANTTALQHREKACVVSFTANNGLVYEGKAWEGDWLVASTRSFGAYAIAIDTIAPKITPLNSVANSNINKQQTIAFKITDDLSGVDSFRGTVNGKWVVMDYDPKTSRLVYTIDETTTSGRNTFELTVTDNLGNQSNYTANFTR
ncbi:MAG: M23 family metallopeptidase [Schleiferiaceae bacterium]|nr:M23 family metallopeptidase [Schleiferiaceae bacterium]